MLARLTRPLALAVLATFPGAGPGHSIPWREDPPQERASLADALATLQPDWDAGRWQATREGLLEILEIYRDDPLLPRQLARILYRIERCGFWLEYRRPKPEEVVQDSFHLQSRTTEKVTLKSYDPRTGKLALEYRYGAPDEGGSRGSGSADLGRPAAFGQAVHDAAFVGPFTLEVKGRMPEAKGRIVPGIFVPMLAAGVGTEGQVVCAFGVERYQMNALQTGGSGASIQQGLEEPVLLARKDPSPVQVGKPYSVKIQINTKSVAMSYRGKRVLSAKLETPAFGRVALQACPRVEKVTLSGEVSPAWIPDLIDNHTQRAWLEFNRSDHLARSVPSWVRETFPGLPRRPDDRPSWIETHEFKSEHFSVQSDVDTDACAHIAGLLEQCLRVYQHRIRRLPPARREGPRFQVYLFASRLGYQVYCAERGIEGGHTSAGMYFPFGRRLLAWNTSDAERLDEVVRHEGSHQYLNQLVDKGPPVWLSEGLAAYFETLEYERGRAVEGLPNTRHLQTLLTTSWIPMSELFSMNSEAFYSNPKLHYAQAWGAVHFLLQNGNESRGRFDRMIDVLVSRGRYAEANQAVVGEGDGESFAQEVWAHVQDL